MYEVKIINYLNSLFKIYVDVNRKNLN